MLTLISLSCEDRNQSVDENSKNDNSSYWNSRNLNLENDNSDYWNSCKLNLEDIQDPQLANYRPADSAQIAAVRNSDDEFKIEYGSSAGECIGFCERTKSFSSAGIITISKRWGDGYIKTEYRKIDRAKYKALIESIDFKEFIDFNENLGCGDCADAGNEWLKISNKTETKQVSGTYGYKVEAVQELLSFFRGA
jgi:hypothetical protein